MSRKPKSLSLKLLKKDPRISDAWEEELEDPSHEGNYWASLIPGWISAEGTTMLHTYSIEDLFMEAEWLEECGCGAACRGH